MKKLLLTLPLAVVALLSISSSVIAQDDKPKAPGGPGRVDPAERLKMMSEKLGLNDEQQAKVKDLLAKSGDKMKALREDKALSQEDRRAKMQEIRKDEMEQMRTILTPEQQEKFKAMRPAGRGGKPADAK